MRRGRGNAGKPKFREARTKRETACNGALPLLFTLYSKILTSCRHEEGSLCCEYAQHHGRGRMPRVLSSLSLSSCRSYYAAVALSFQLNSCTLMKGSGTWSEASRSRCGVCAVPNVTQKMPRVPPPRSRNSPSPPQELLIKLGSFPRTCFKGSALL